MALSTGRLRAASSQSHDEIFSPVTSSALSRLHELLGIATSTTTVNTIEEAEGLSNVFYEIRMILVDSSNKHDTVKTEFRRCGGFEACLQAMKSISSSSELFDFSIVEKARGFHGLIQSTLHTLSEALFESRENHLYFVHEQKQTRWLALQGSLQRVMSRHDMDTDQKTAVNIRIFGMLFGLSLREDDASSILKSARPRIMNLAGDSDPQKQASPTAKLIVWFPEALSMIVAIWKDVTLRDSDMVDLSIAVVEALATVCKNSDYNLVLAHRSNILDSLLAAVLSPDVSPTLQNSLQNLCSSLIRFGLGGIREDVSLFRAAFANEAARSILLQGLASSQNPPHILFDFSVCGHASVELKSISDSFPPQDPAKGYTFACWLRVDAFDALMHTTIFGAFDESQTCFVLLYLERDTHQLVMQTSVTASKPSIRFKSKVFEPGKWYFISIVHLLPRPEKSSRASLFVDGKLTEKLQCHYPARPPWQPGSPRRRRDRHKPEGRHRAQVQAFFGTPQDLSPRVGANLLNLKWALANAWLIAEALPEELLVVYHSLGPGYSGNFQDCLGSFQTYAASARLNMLNERLHAQDEDRSIIARAIRGKAMKLNPEEKFVWHLSPRNVLTASDFSGSQDKGRVEARQIQKHRHDTGNPTRNTRHNYVTNRMPCKKGNLNDTSTGILVGAVASCVPARLDDLSWRLCGCLPLTLQILTTAGSPQDIQLALTLSFEMIRHNWRISEAFERQNGFALLASVLSSKVTSSIYLHHNNSDQNSEQCTLLETILKFIGFDADRPSEAIIDNPLAYKSFLIDSDIWRTGDQQTQELYYQQFSIFVTDSKHRHFNMRRLARMRVAKKFVESMDQVAQVPLACAALLRALKICIQCSPTTEVFRALALYISTATASMQTTETSADAVCIPDKAVGAADHMDRVSTFQLGLLALTVLREVFEEDLSSIHLKKFAKTVTIKWVLNLLAINSAEVVMSAVRILALLLTSHPPSYTESFADRSNGFDVLRARLSRWWHIGAIWNDCFALLFGVGIARKDPPQEHFDAEWLLRSLEPMSKSRISCPQMLGILTTMLESCVLHFTRLSGTKEAASANEDPNKQPENPLKKVDNLLSSVLSFMLDIQEESAEFREFTATSDLVRHLMGALYAPLLIRSEVTLSNGLSDRTNLFPSDRGVSVDMHSRDSEIETFTNKASEGPIGISKVSSRPDLDARRRASSFVMVEPPGHDASQAQASRTSSKLASTSSYHFSKILETRPIRMLADLLVASFVDQVLQRKDYTGLGLYLKAPPCPPSVRSHVNALLMSKTALCLEQHVSKSWQMLQEPKVLINLARFISQGYEAFIEGWYDNGHAALTELSTAILTVIQQRELHTVKSVRLCRSSLCEIRDVLVRALIVYLSHDKFDVVASSPINLISSITAVDKSWLGPSELDDLAAAALLYVLYCLLQRSSSQDQRSHSVSRSEAKLLAMHVKHMAELFDHEGLPQVNTLVESLTYFEVSSETSHAWLDEKSSEIETALGFCRDTFLLPFVARQRETSVKLLSSRQSRRMERLEAWHLQDIAFNHIWTEHLTSAHRWIDNIQSSEHLKHLRIQQDRIEALEYLQSQVNERLKAARCLDTSLQDTDKTLWQLDATEARDRMRLRLSPVPDAEESKYEPKSTRVLRRSTARKQTLRKAEHLAKGSKVPDTVISDDHIVSKVVTDAATDDFELITGPIAEENDDKNRRVLRSLEKGEEVQNVYNVARVIGLDAKESLLIVGRKCLYLVEGLFQRSDGEILNVWEAPMSERDQYAHIVSGHEIDMRRSAKNLRKDRTMHWKWADIISFSKRRFLTRSVALEVFFSDGLSLLLTASDQQRRDGLYTDVLGRIQDLKAKAPTDSNSMLWRTDMLKAPTENTSRLSSMFAPAFSKPITKRWSRGELSNFQYLILINTLAGRTFNDITQYPIFPWVLADYTSDELDLTNPRSFRDLSKPMGCQHIERAEAFRERYASFAEMDETTPAFHYGTHYSSATIVTSFLIRLEPYVRSHVLLQAGSFDHADRLFYSIGKAWLSASKETFSDVRELIPEFFYLPDFLTNVNGYDFGVREMNQEPVNHVELPPWAKGSPALFIQKHREALESPYVSQNLHNWIDLVFGFKQQGEAALEATNVFHYLSYAGSKDLDTIQDQHERAATVGILHNFGLTPSQVFQRPHERRETNFSPGSKVDKMFKSMQRAPTATLDLGLPVAAISLLRQVRATGPETLLLPTHPDLRMQWGFQDQTVAFSHAETNQVRARFEQLHIDDVLAAAATDSGTVITASQDSTITAWKMRVTANDIELHHMTSLFDHETAVNALFVSEIFVTLLSADVDGRILLWDLNRLSLIREIRCLSAVDALLMSTVTGNILVRRGDSISVYTLNGTELIHEQVPLTAQADNDSEDEDVLTCVSYYEPADNAWIEHDLVLTGSARGRVDVWATVPASDTGRWRLEHRRSLVGRRDPPLLPRHGGSGGGGVVGVSCVKAVGGKVFAGWADGRVFEFVVGK